MTDFISQLKLGDNSLAASNYQIYYMRTNEPKQEIYTIKLKEV